MGRTRYIKNLCKQAVFKGFIFLMSSIYTVFTIWRDEFATTEQQNWRIVKMLPYWPTSWWIAITLGTFIIWLFESSYREAKRLQNRIDELEQKEASPLEIIFDPNNPYKRFWSIEEATNYDGVEWEYRVEIRNNSQKTLKNVSVTKEHIGALSDRQAEQIFDKIQKTACDINPNCSKLVPILRWPIPIIQPGMLAGKAALAYGPIRVIASANDVKPANKLFQFDYQREPMLF